MITFIFGAGASFDSASESSADLDERFRPCLTRDLFSNKNWYLDLQDNHGITTLAYTLDIAAKKNQNIEELLEKEAENPKSKNEIIGLRFYLSDLFKTISSGFIKRKTQGNYVSLTRFLQRHVSEEIAYMTFNYDFLIETALEEVFSFKYKNINEYLDQEIKLIKFHGSCNWGYRLNKIQTERLNSVYHGRVSDFAVSEGNDLLSNNDIQFQNPDWPSLPAIAIPLINKNDSHFVCPSNAIDEAKRILNETSLLVLIGWKAQEHHFNTNILKKLNANAKIIIVSDSPGSCQKIQQHLKQYYAFKDFFHLAGGFSGSLGSQELQKRIQEE